MPDRTLGEVLHEAREAGNDGRDRPLILHRWADRDPRLKALDEDMAAAVEAEVRRRIVARDAQLFALGVHLPAVLDALRLAAADALYGARARRFGTALAALGGSEEAPDAR